MCFFPCRLKPYDSFVWKNKSYLISLPVLPIQNSNSTSCRACSVAFKFTHKLKGKQFLNSFSVCLLRYLEFFFQCRIKSSILLPTITFCITLECICFLKALITTNCHCIFSKTFIICMEKQHTGLECDFLS